MMKLYRFLKLVFVIVCCVASVQALAQGVQITGKVTSGDDGTALPGVSIVEKGTTNGTVSDADGNYSVTVKSDAVLVFSFVGYAAQEIAVGGQTVLNVSLASDITALSEVVVVGYGTREKKDVTGVITAVDSENFNRGAIVAPDQLINGKVAGVQITSNGGEPGGASTIRIRGGTSLNASNEPLYVIDGVPIDNVMSNASRNPLNFINPNDIETFTVMKDASAAAIYGARAANGVIIITTKKGKKGASTVTYDGWYSMGNISNQLDVFNADQFREIMAAKAPDRLDDISTDESINTDWQDQVYRTAIGKSHSLTFNGGTDKTGFRVSISDLSQEGVVKKSETQRTNFGFNLNSKFLDDNLKIDVNVKGSQTKDIFPGGGAVGNSLAFAPTQPVKDPTSIYGGYWEWANNLGTKNPVAELNLIDDQAKMNRSVGNMLLTYDLPWVKGLQANANFGYDMANGARRKFTPTYARTQVAFQDTDNDEQLDTLYRGEIWREEVIRMNKLMELYGSYTRDIESINGRFDITAGYSYQDFTNEYPGSTSDTLTTNNFGYYNPGIAKHFNVYNSVQENRLISFFGRANISVKDKYILNLSIRRDGSSRFGTPWGTFPAAAFAWRIYDETFMQGLQNVFSDLKIRVGYGINGSQEIANYLYLPTFTQSDREAQYQFGNSFYGSIRPNGYDSKIKWEETAQLNIGIDFGLLKGRLTGSLEFYDKKTSDLLFEVGVPAGTNLTNKVLSNIGEMSNKGIELSLDAVAISTADLTWNIGFNISANKNEILALDGSDDPGFRGYPVGGISGGVGNNIQILKVGQPANAFWVYRHKTVNGKPIPDGIDVNEDGKADDLDMYVDIDENGKIDDNDRQPYKQAAPKVIAGLSSSLFYKNFDLTFTLRANFGNYNYNNVASSTAYYNRVTSAEQVPQNMLTSVAETNFTKAQYFSNYYVQDASFVRMDNLTLGYTKRLGSANFRIYSTVQNLFVLTDYSGLDPEVANTPQVGAITRGIDNNIYPRSRTFIFGVSVGL